MASIRKLADGRWQAQFRPVPGGKQVTRTTQRKADAQRWLDEQQALVLTGHFVNPESGKITFGAYYEQWRIRQIWTRGTMIGMDTTARSVPFWDIPLRLLQRSHLETWVKHMETTHRGNGRGSSVKPGLAPATIRSRFHRLRTVLRAAVAENRMTRDPSAGIRLPRVRRPESVMKLPTVEQVGAILAFAESAFRPFIALCAFAGLRLGEASGLKVGDIDFERRVLNIGRQVQRPLSAEIEVRLPKAGSERTVHLPGNMATMLLAYLADLPWRNDPGAWLFQDRDGGPLQVGTVNRCWTRAKKAANVPGTRLHDLRHFFASGLIAAGCDVVTVQRALGHTTATMTLNIYAHLWPSAEDRTRDAVGAMFDDALQRSDEFVTNRETVDLHS